MRGERGKIPLLMKKNIKITPEGTRDLLFEECTSHKTIISKIADVFKQRGFHEVITPCLEFYDLFRMDNCSIRQESMFKLTDLHGRLMAVRPDSTLPIARMISVRLPNAERPIRLFYNQKVYRNNPDLRGNSNEIMQAGIELVGVGGLRADLEIITTAVEALSANISDFRIELGHAGFFSAIIKQLNAGEDIKEDIKTAIKSKNYSALNMILDSQTESSAVSALRSLPRLFGGEEIFANASSVCICSEVQTCLDYLKKVYECLCEYGLKDKLTVDLGLVQENDYYTGIIFSGYVEGAGDAVAVGGRYDNLLENFSCPMPAAGFGMNIDEITRVIIEKDESIGHIKPADVLVHALDGYEIKAINYSEQLSQKNITCENSVFTALDDAKAYALSKGIAELCVVAESIETIKLN